MTRRSISQSDASPGGASRRTVLKAGAAAALGLGAVRLGGVSAQTATPSASPAACVLTPELTEGPYYVAGELVRQAITEGKAGVPLTLRIAVSDLAACGPLANAAVDIWHCDAQGYYSGITGENPGGGGSATGAENAHTTFLRGIQLTGADGTAEFQTIFPGWYAGRTVHIHMKVHVDGASAAASSDASAAATPTGGETYQGGHVAHTGQLFFADDLQKAVFATAAYVRSSDNGHIYNESDNILGDHASEPGFLVDIAYVDQSSIEKGLIGAIAVGVDPTATPAATSGGGPGGGGPGGPPPSGGPGGPPNGTPPSGA